jgi:hypothetical protein
VHIGCGPRGLIWVSQYVFGGQTLPPQASPAPWPGGSSWSSTVVVVGGNGSVFAAGEGGGSAVVRGAEATGDGPQPTPDTAAEPPTTHPALAIARRRVDRSAAALEITRRLLLSLSNTR